MTPDLRRFLETFALPLVAGGELRIGAPIDAATLAIWDVELGSHSDVTVAIDEARAAIAATLVVRPPAFALAPPDLRLLVALYSALVLAHPRTEGWPSRRGRAALTELAERLTDIAAPAGRAEMLARHTLLAGLFDLSRVDTRVSWWTGRAEFKGTPAPRRLTLWRSVRRVKEEHSEVPLAEIVSDEAAAIVTRLIQVSPLTDLATLGAPGRRFPGFRWDTGVAEALRDAELARAVAYCWLGDLAERGADPAVRLRAAAAACDAWEEALAAPLEVLGRVRLRTSERAGRTAALAPADLRAATAFLVHLCGLVAVAEAAKTPAADADAPSPLVSAGLAAKRTAEPWDLSGGLRLLFAVPDVAGRVDPALGEPPGVGEEPLLRRRWAAHRAQVKAAFGDERLAQLARRLAVALGTS
jgi:hypothetical protein